jgi:putative glycerol-1-phosphate prenyltransferase
MQVMQTLIEAKNSKGGGFLLLLDPDRKPLNRLIELTETAGESDVDALLIGSSFILKSNFHQAAREIKAHATIPVIIFPGAHSQLTPHADAVLFMSLISGRNPQYLIDEQVRGAPIVKETGLEVISTGYMLIESGRSTSVEFISNTTPLPHDKPDLVGAHALAAQYMGMSMVFMEAGSGAGNPVSDDLIRGVASYIDIPIIVGGGIRHPGPVEEKITAGASFVVVGDHFENSRDYSDLARFARAAHPLQKVSV